MKNSSAALGDDVLFSSTNVFCTMKLQPIIYLLRLPKIGAPISCSLCRSHSLFLIINLTYSIPGQRVKTLNRRNFRFNNDLLLFLTENTGLQFKTAFDQFFSNETVDLSSFNIQCCQANDCNNQSVVPLPSPTVAPSASTTPTVKLTSSTNITPTSHASRFYPFTGILASVFIALNVSLKKL